MSAFSKALGKAYNTADHLIQHFIQAGILQEAESKLRGQCYRFEAYLQLLEKDEERLGLDSKWEHHGVDLNLTHEKQANVVKKRT